MTVKMKDLVRGNTRAVNVTFKQSDGSAADLTGGKVFFAATTQTAPVDDTSAAINVGPVTVHTDPTNGKSRIILLPTDTRVTPGSYNVGVQAVLSDGTVIEDTGKLKVKSDFKVATT